MLRLLTVLIGLAPCGVLAAAPCWEMPGSLEEGGIMVTAKGVQYPEEVCLFPDGTEFDGEPITATCSGEETEDGGTYSRSIRLTPTPNGMLYKDEFEEIELQVCDRRT